MKSWLVRAFCLLGLVGCCTLQPPDPVPPRLVTAAERAEARSVALIEEDRAVCGGVWVGEDRILTALHCVLDEKEAEENVTYSTKEGTTTHPFELFSAKIERFDASVDLALLTTKGFFRPMWHEKAMLSTKVIHDGDEIDVIGSTKGLPFTYLHGQVSATREGFGLGFKVLQVSVAGVNGGNSGGGAFDASGRLVGIADYMMAVDDRMVPSIAFFTHRDILFRFLYPKREE